MTRRALAFAALLACGGQKTTTTTAPTPSASATGAASVTPPEPGVGRVDPEAVRKVIREAREHFLICYAAGLKKKKDLAGRVETKFVIDETGHVISAEDVTHSNVLPDDATRDCIVSKFRKLEFPPPQPSGRVPITYPLLLDPTMVVATQETADAGAPPPTDDYHHGRAPFDTRGAAQSLGKVDLKACTQFHGAGHVKVTFDPSGVVTKATLDSPPGAGKTPGGECVTKAFAAVRVAVFSGEAVTVGKSFHVP